MQVNKDKCHLLVIIIMCNCTAGNETERTALAQPSAHIHKVKVKTATKAPKQWQPPNQFKVASTTVDNGRTRSPRTTQQQATRPPATSPQSTTMSIQRRRNAYSHRIQVKTPQVASQSRRRREQALYKKHAKQRQQNCTNCTTLRPKSSP